ncbi:hypothetical protein V9T40_004030 [Parthenolecanium corni]|uniref:Major facilitator superfamily (MFS) profile domain-containing protein n=1 Tax=Parthenolecanium corni TaxID=536013 RepID=A0AAN9TSF3_9HEMI
MCYLLLGVGCGWVSPILNRFRNSDTDFSLTTEACSLIASLHYIGRAAGSILAAALVNRIGRNMAFVATSLISCATWSTVFSTFSIPAHYAARVAFGVCVGLTEFTTALYVGENSSPTLRGVLSSAMSILFYSGELLMFIIGAYQSYATIALVNVALSLATVASTLLLREPAQHLLAKGDLALAEKRFLELRGTSDASKCEFQETKQQLTDGQTVNLQLLADRSVRVVVILSTSVYITGYPVINLMASLIMSSTSKLTPNELTIVMGVIMLLGISATPLIIERFGRRPLFMTSMVVSLLSNLAVAAIFWCQTHGHPIAHSAWLVFGSLTIYSTSVAAVMYPVITTIRGELMSPQLKAVGGCLAIVVNSILSLVMTGVFLSIAEAYGIEMNFLIFAASSAAVLLYAYFELPETRGLTLTEIQRSLKK